MNPSAPVCPYCKELSLLKKGREVYPHLPELQHKNFYVCEPCDARVGCHAKTLRPLGRLADAELRVLKIRAHAAFDPIWRSENTIMSRNEAYEWLSVELKINRRDCHIGEFDVDLCRRAIDACELLRSARKKK